MCRLALGHENSGSNDPHFDEGVAFGDGFRSSRSQPGMVRAATAANSTQNSLLKASVLREMF